jgi:hypothetical protein
MGMLRALQWDLLSCADVPKQYESAGTCDYRVEAQERHGVVACLQDLSMTPNTANQQGLEHHLRGARKRSVSSGGFRTPSGASMTESEGGLPGGVSWGSAMVFGSKDRHPGPKSLSESHRVSAKALGLEPMSQGPTNVGAHWPADQARKGFMLGQPDVYKGNPPPLSFATRTLHSPPNMYVLFVVPHPDDSDLRMMPHMTQY